MKTNKGFIGIGILIAIIAILAAGGGAVYYAKKNSKNNKVPEVNNQTNNSVVNVAVQPTVQEGTITSDLKNPNILTYTSSKLGVQFSYLKDGGTSFFSPNSKHIVSIKIVENGDKISFVDVVDGKEYPNNGDYVRVFQKTSGESVEQTLRRVVPEQFNSINCSVFKSNGGYFIWDKRVALNYRGGDGTDYMGSDGKYLQNVCAPQMNLDFKTDSNFPNTIYYIERSTQAPSYYAYYTDYNHNKQWFETVHLINIKNVQPQQVSTNGIPDSFTRLRCPNDKSLLPKPKLYKQNGKYYWDGIEEAIPVQNKPQQHVIQEITKDEYMRDYNEDQNPHACDITPVCGANGLPC